MNPNDWLLRILTLLSTADDDRVAASAALSDLSLWIAKGEPYPDVHKCLTEWLETDRAWIQFADKLRRETTLDSDFCLLFSKWLHGIRGK